MYPTDPTVGKGESMTPWEKWLAYFFVGGGVAMVVYIACWIVADVLYGGGK